jgi:hypothetical protein
MAKEIKHSRSKSQHTTTKIAMLALESVWLKAWRPS